MNKFLLIILFFTIFQKKAKTQTTDTIDDLNISQFDICLNGKPASNKNTILLDKKYFLQKFGAPKKTTKEYSEMDEDTLTHFNYSGADVWFQENSMQAINIFSAHFSLRIKDGTILKVGDPVFLLIKRFPNSWANKQSPNQLFVSLRDQNVFVDMNLVFDIDPKTNKIKEIALQ